MADYRIYYVNEHGSIDKGFDAQCLSDEDALDLAHRLTAISPRIEAWLGTRLVGCLCDEEVLLWRPQKAVSVAAGVA